MMADSDNNGRQTQVMDRPLLKLKQVAGLLGISIKTVNHLVRKGDLRCVQVTKKERRFTHEQVQEFIERQSDTRPTPVDKPASGRIPSHWKGGEKSSGVSGTGLSKEIRSLCRS